MRKQTNKNNRKQATKKPTGSLLGEATTATPSGEASALKAKHSSAHSLDPSLTWL